MQIHSCHRPAAGHLCSDWASGVFLSALLLLVYAAARHCVPGRLPRWLPAWMWPVVPLVVSALPATFLVNLFVLKGDVSAIVILRHIAQVVRGTNDTAHVHLNGHKAVLPVSRSYLHVFRQM